MASVGIQDGTQRYVKFATYPPADRGLTCSDAACLTCRQKSRRCDRARPMCRRCISKGLECAGYPDKFRFCGIASRGKWKNHEAPISKGRASTPDADSSTQNTTASSQQTQFHSRDPPSKSNANGPSSNPRTPNLFIDSPQRNTPSHPSELSRILYSTEAKRLLTHCELIF